MRQSLLKTTAGLLLFFIITFAAEANSLFQADISAGCGVISGDTDYTIGGKIKTPAGSYYAHFPVSKLDFPIEASILSLQAGITLKKKLSCSVSWGRSLAGDPDKMIDHDWERSPAELSIYSESRLDMEADIISVKIGYRIFQADLGLDRHSSLFSPGDSWQLLAGAGYLYRQFDFKAGNTLQIYPGQSDSYDYFSGRTLNYSVEYRIPFMELAMLLKIKNRNTAEVSAGYSPLVEANDEDQHLLRDMWSYADCEGEALILSFNYRCEFLKRWYAALSLSHLKIQTDGDLKTYINGNWAHTIYTEIASRQFLATLALGFMF